MSEIWITIKFIFLICLVSLLAVSEVPVEEKVTGDHASVKETTDEVVSVENNDVILL